MTSTTASYLASNVDAATRQRMYDGGAFLVFHDFPVGAEFGIDYTSWRVGEAFKGMKMIPPGVHLIYFTLINPASITVTSPRIAFWHEFKSGEVLVKRWDKANEDMDWAFVAEEDEVQRCRDNLKEMDTHLAAYPYERYKQWFSLTQFIGGRTIRRLEPKNLRISSQANLESEEVAQSSSQKVDREHPTRERFRDDDGLPIMNEKHEERLRFTTIAKNKVPAGATGAEVSQHGRDWSNYLHRFIDEEYGGDHRAFLGELQFAFVCFLVAHIYEGFEQWKRLTHLLCRCYSAPSTETALYTDVLTLLFHQLNECPEEFFTDIVTADNFLVRTLGELFGNIGENDEVRKELKEKAVKLRMYLNQKFKIEFKDPESE